MDNNILVTGGLGFIGSHTCIELIAAGYNPIIVDNLSNCKISVLDRLKTITGKNDITFYESDVCDQRSLSDIFKTNKPKAVIHFAGLKAVGESVAKPLSYYQTNIKSTLSLLECMSEHNVHAIVFSSSATVYGEKNAVPYKEDMATGDVTSPYGRTKYMIEEILKDVQAAHPAFSATILRYFNPVGAHESGIIGEDPNGIPNNLMPIIENVVKGKLPELKVWGNDYDTHDGTGVRDYLHVTDLAIGHVKALNTKQNEAGTHIYNLGTGRGQSVMDMIHVYQKTIERDIPYIVANRRSGDIAEFYADASKAKNDLDWDASKTIEDMTKDSWKWVQNSSKFE